MRGPSLLVLFLVLAGASSDAMAQQTTSGDAIDARIARNVSTAAPPPPEPLFPVKNQNSAKAQADADLASREANDKARLTVDRVNLKGKSAAPALQKGMSPANYDRSIQMGDKDHVQQSTSLKIYLKPPPEAK